MKSVRQEALALLGHYAASLARLADELDGDAIGRAVDLIRSCSGMVVVTGMGKAGIIGQKISATLASTGTPSIFLHPSEAIHGDLGRVQRNDVVLALSNSGASEEVIRLLNPLKRIGASLIAVTGRAGSPLATHADVVIPLGSFAEAGPIGLVPTTSTMLMLAIGDVIAVATMNRKNFSREEFALFHPGGALGRELLTVGEVMRRGEENPIIGLDASIAQALIVMTQTKGRPGAVSIVDDTGTLVGMFTDGDFRRRASAALGARDFTFFSLPLSQVMTRAPRTIGPEKLASEALNLLRSHRIDQLPVIDEQGHPIGLLDVQDLLDVGLG
ncbi:MAG: KpsF/GutQ family sugar-phosphate isomerase [Planctomycetota bacterium]